jgi:hypothetical protein
MSHLYARGNMRLNNLAPAAEVNMGDRSWTLLKVHADRVHLVWWIGMSLRNT